MANFAGLLTTDTANTSDYVGEWQRGVLIRNTKGLDKGTTLFGLMSRLPAENASAVQFNWWERDPSRLNYYSNAAFTSTATTLTFTDISLSTDATPLLRNGAFLTNARSGEQIVLTADPSSGNAIVTRGIYGTTAAAISSGDLWTRITAASPEGTGIVRDSYEDPTNYYNFIQTHKSSVQISNAYKGTELRTDAMGPLKARRTYALEQIAKDIELAWFFGTRGITQSNQYTTGGIVWAIQQAAAANSAVSANILNGLGTSGCPIASFRTWLQSFMVKGSNTKILFSGPNAYAALSNYATSAVNGFRIGNLSNDFGMNITEIMTPYGTANLVMHPLFNDAVAFNNTMVAVDLTVLQQKTMEKLCLLDNQQANDYDTYVEQFRAKIGLSVKFPQAMGYATNLQSFV